MNVTCTTLFKVRKEVGTMLALNLATVAFTGAGSLVGGYVAHSVHVIIGALVVAIVCRSLWAERHFNRELGVPANSISLGEIAVTLAFVLLATLLPAPAAMLGYVVVYVTFLFLNKKDLLRYVRKAVR